jgi:hypothetical protein
MCTGLTGVGGGSPIIEPSPAELALLGPALGGVPLAAGTVGVCVPSGTSPVFVEGQLVLTPGERELPAVVLLSPERLMNPEPWLTDVPPGVLERLELEAIERGLAGAIPIGGQP